MNDKNLRLRPETLFQTILHDTHFWIPLLVLIAGMLFLRMLH